MTEFYEKTGRVTLLVIKHRGERFDYINGTRNQPYFERWNSILPFMKVNSVYVVACEVRLNSRKANLYPFGIAFEVSESQGKAISLQHRSDVMSGNWSPHEEYTKLIEDCRIYKENYLKIPPLHALHKDAILQY